MSFRSCTASRICRGEGGPITSVVATLLDNLHLPTERLDHVVSVAGKREVRRMRTHLQGLAVIARVAPLLGLLGTVVGLVEAFLAVSRMQGPPNPSILADGIWQALLTTVAGLMVAIPAILSHEWLRGLVDELVYGMQEAVSNVLATDVGGSPAREG